MTLSMVITFSFFHLLHKQNVKRSHLMQHLASSVDKVYKLDVCLITGDRITE